MNLQCGFVLLFLNCLNVNGHSGFIDSTYNGLDQKFSFWPSMHNGVKLHLRKREVNPPEVAHSEGGNVATPNDTSTIKPQVQVPQDLPPQPPAEVQTPDIESVPEHAKVNITANTISNNTATNATLPKVHTESAKQNQTDWSNPNVLKRGFIVFGGFSLMAVAYFIFYRRKSNKKDSSNSNNDGNQFRYGVLQSEDTRDKMELSRMPLTMESDDEDDEDLEIFDLGQKKKSLSCLETNDEDIVFPRGHDEDLKDALLLDIEDQDSDTLINWSNSGSKSIL